MHSFCWLAFSHIWTERADLQSKPLYSVQMRENADQKNSEYGHFSHSWTLQTFQFQ